MTGYATYALAALAGGAIAAAIIVLLQRRALAKQYTQPGGQAVTEAIGQDDGPESTAPEPNSPKPDLETQPAEEEIDGRPGVALQAREFHAPATE